MKKAMIAMLLMSAMVLGLLIYFRQGVVACEMVGDAKQVRKVDGSTKMNIENIVKKYISIGARQEQVEQYLKACKFELYPQPILADKKQEIMVAHIVRGSVNFLGFHDEIRIVVEFENGAVSGVEGWVFYHAL
ncbi:hypothetical protein [Chromobacterium sp. ATCC 53434]|uniref:hypothetical protein n=1 Tax=Chromobacterium sp. (strain ATCC 53434 / SC 14030) TaxID=2059672 RepID=UPI0013052801|nr:hypothetical protein [Chromobacterium sp. ATCC 53434]